MREAVYNLYQAGYHIIPTEPYGKRPLIKWKEYDIRLSELLEYDLQHISIATGYDGLMVIDIDSKNAENQDDMNHTFMERLQNLGFNMNTVLIQETVSKGVHIFFRTDRTLSDKKLSRNKDGQILVELLSDGQLVKVYDHSITDNILDLPIIQDDELDILITVSASFNEYKADSKAKLNSKKEYNNDFNVYNQTHTCLEILLNHNWTIVSEDQDEVRVKRDGNTSSYSSGVIFPYDDRALIYSSSTQLPTGVRLSPADITCHMDFNGDYTAFRESLIGVVVPAYNKSTSTTWLDDWNPEPFEQVLDRAKKLPPINSLMGSLMFENEFSIFFGRTNVGKTTACFQIATAIANGEPLWGLENNAGPKTTLYMDFEHSERQIAKRYGSLNEFPKNLFYIAGPKFDTLESFDDWSKNTMKNIEAVQKKCGAEVLVIDNITALQEDSSKAEQAVQLVKSIKYLKEKLQITILLVGHPTKHPAHIPLSINQMAGSSKLAALCDAIFAMNFNNEMKNGRYIQSMKVRSSELIYDSNHVLKLVLKDDRGFPEFHYDGIGQESDLIGTSTKMDIDSKKDEVIQLLKDGYSCRNIAEITGVSKSSVGLIRKELDLPQG